MIYLAEQLVVILMIAFVVGICVGWVTSGKRNDQKTG